MRLCHTWLCSHNLFRSLTCLCQNCPLQDTIQRWVRSLCHHLDYSNASHLMCNGLWHQSVIWTNSEAAGAHFAGCGPDGHEYGNGVCFATSNSCVSGCFRRMFCVCFKFAANNKDVWIKYDSVMYQSNSQQINPTWAGVDSHVNNKINGKTTSYCMCYSVGLLKTPNEGMSWKRRSKALQLAVTSVSDVMHSLCMNLPLHEWACSVRSYYI